MSHNPTTQHRSMILLIAIGIVVLLVSFAKISEIPVRQDMITAPQFHGTD